mmetsp:Transcript_72088/g.168698  ORF Transcript_72088/g.168698 Transcript_72088/m.168698 type:complete len:397 (-) Transcript_72088:59-1249(-)
MGNCACTVNGVAVADAGQEITPLSPRDDLKDVSSDGDIEEISTNLPSSRTIPCSVANEDFQDPASLAEDITPLKEFVEEGEVSEAIERYEQLELIANESGDGKLLATLHQSTGLHDLRAIIKRRRGFLKRLVEPSWKEHSEWTYLEIAEPEIDPNFKLTFRMRFARGDERNHARGGTQIMVGAHAVGFPVNLTQLVAYHSRVHHIKKEWLKDCEKIVGLPASDHNLYSATLTSLLAPKVLPFKLEDVIIRNFIVCKEAPPIPGCRPGVMVMESSPDEEQTHIEGLELPKPRRGVIQITGSEKLNHFMPSIVGPNHVDAICSIRAQLPLPQWLISLDLVKRFLADIFSNTLKVIKQQVANDWDKLPFNDDIEADPKFFAKIQEIVEASTAKPCTASL